jgi:hypothetical protein
LASDNPFVVLAAVVERAKHGDHSQARRLVPFFMQEEPFALARESLLAFADIAPNSEMHHIDWALRDAALTSDNPFVVLAAVVEYAKRGDHSQATRLVPFFTQHEPFALARVALLAFADIAVSDFFHAFAPQRLDMAAILEDFLRTKAAGYVPGRRHFYGHPIP